ncbi:2TM domain-containing protein [Tenacibaculum sp. SG-28]|uniref:2TM domain-containing protein n=1 Tax=Tenacibaculum sp. SG-28 TaxID=754426 RepID=UPI002100856F|nr:2TM domain-containing protein [Tenacibaculum sp. SG-28]
MEQEFLEERKYLQAKKRVEKIKGFYWHFISYVVVNIFVSSIIIFGIMKDTGAFCRCNTRICGVFRLDFLGNRFIFSLVKYFWFFLDFG